MDASLAQLVSEIRSAMATRHEPRLEGGEDGYAFAGDLRPKGADAPASRASAVRWWLIFDQREIH